MMVEVPDILNLINVLSVKMTLLCYGIMKMVCILGVSVATMVLTVSLVL